MILKELPIYYTENDFVIDLPQNFELESIKSTPLKTYLKKFEDDKYCALYELSFNTQQTWFSTGLAYLHQITSLMLETIAREPLLELARGSLITSLDDSQIEQLLADVPYVVGSEFVSVQWINQLCQTILKIYNLESDKYPGTIKQYLTAKNNRLHVADKIFFHLVENDEIDYPFAFMATYSQKTSKEQRTPHTPLKQALSDYKDDTDVIIKLIAAVIKVAEESALIKKLLNSGELFSAIKLTSDEAYTFLKEIDCYESHGIICRIPNWWQKKRNKITLQMVATERQPAYVGLDAIVSMTPKFDVDGQIIDQQAIESFLAMAEGLVKYKGKWIEINHKRLNALLKAFEQIKANPDAQLTVADVIKLQAGLTQENDILYNSTVEINNEAWLKQFKHNLTNAQNITNSSIPVDITATLRPYQIRGYNWLLQMYHYKFGACLADDMGLGKTLQVITLLDYLREAQAGPALIILPASLIANWQDELEKFAPKIDSCILHPKYNDNIEISGKNAVYLTTYNMVKRLRQLQDVQWKLIVLDESQAIKNPNTLQTKAIKALKADRRLALTGTPIENRLSDLWSLFDFLNPGLLGTASQFKKMVKQLEHNSHGYHKIRKMIQPFMMRRLKTDKSIIADLPEKIEIVDYATLSDKQVALYNQVVNNLELQLEDAEGIQRKGLVLATLTKLKQICNHPAHYLGLDEYNGNASGKFGRLNDICQTIFQKRERVLIFTQYKQIINPLAQFLETQFGRSGLVLHGSTSIKKRGELVAEFNGERYIPFMVLSLKAGGVGLNLTAANHVIHFDRWWNPAVENQATDRAFRIGQTKCVMVHKLVSKNTIEEKIDAMIADKTSLSKNLLNFGAEKWLTEMSNSEMMALFRMEQ